MAEMSPKNALMMVTKCWYLFLKEIKNEHEDKKKFRVMMKFMMLLMGVKQSTCPTQI